MSKTTSVPVVFLAFADSVGQGHLSELKQESKELYNLLLPLKKTGQIDLLREHHTDNEIIPRRLTDFHNQIFIFHYGGHADGNHLYFEDKKGHVQGLGELLSLQKSLQVVFLNGCETQEQALQYVEAGIPAVIATTRSVADTDARFFATYFYQALANRLTLEEAFKIASATLKLKTDFYTSEQEEIVIVRGVEFRNRFQDNLPWRLYIADSHAQVLNWSLPETMTDEHKVTYVLADSQRYLEIRGRIEQLEREMQEKQEQLNAFPEALPESLLPVKKSIEVEQIRLAEELEQKRGQEQELKKQVIDLASTFNRIELNTERLKKAKAYFENGQFQEADAILKTEEMIVEKDQLLEARNQKELELAALKQQLRSKSDEFLIKAELTISLQWEKTNWFEEAKQYFKHSLQSDIHFENGLTYANFLQKHNQFQEAISQYQQVFELPLTREEKATTLNNLANLHLDTTNYSEARACYEEALQIRRQLAQINTQAYLPNLANTLNNLANLHMATINYSEASACYNEALQIYRQLAQINPKTFLPDVAMSLNNLANLHIETTNFSVARVCNDEALQIRRQLAQVNPKTFLPDVAMSLNNLANLHMTMTNQSEARTCYNEALQIYRQLAQVNPKAFLPYVAGTLNNLANLHKATTSYSVARAYYNEALQIYRQLAQVNPQAFLPDVAGTLNNLANLHIETTNYCVASVCYDEALQIYRQLAQVNTQAFLPYVAGTLNNLANLNLKTTNYTVARASYEEALQIYRQLAQVNTQAFGLNLAMTLINVGIFYSQDVVNRDLSLVHTKEGFWVALPFLEKAPAAQKHVQTAIQILQAWGIDSEEKLNAFLKE